MLGLELELAGELLVLLDREARGALKFVLSEVEHVGLDLLDLEEHLFAHLFHAFVLLSLQLSN